jgi:cytochrome c556
LSLDGVVEAIRATFAHELGRMHEANNQHLSKQLAGLIKAPQDDEEGEYPLDKEAFKQLSAALKKMKKRSERESQSAAKGGQEATRQEVAQHNPQSPVVEAHPLPQDSPGAAESI